jgi:AraC-like DNA-binding protein
MQDGQTSITPDDDHSIAPLTINPDRMHVTHFTPPAKLSAYVTQIYMFSCDEPILAGVQPAALGQLLFMLNGTGSVRFAGQQSQAVPMVHYYGPCKAAMQFSMNGPVQHYGLALSPLGFVALTGKSAKNCADQIFDAADIFGEDINQLCNQLRESTLAGEMRPAQIVEAIAAFLLPFMRKTSLADVDFIHLVFDWLSSSLNPDIAAFYAKLDMSRSTATRLISKYFGASPKLLARKYRALRSATILTDAKTDAQMRTQIQSLYYDQSHMIREIRHFTGCTPSALDGIDAKILRLWLSKENYRDLETYPG